jgi:hypothetical protein
MLQLQIEGSAPTAVAVVKFDLCCVEERATNENDLNLR